MPSLHVIAQISDLHISPQEGKAEQWFQVSRRLEEAVAHLLALDPRPDLVVLTGDLIDDGTPEEYTILRRLLQPLTMPFYLLPGNHDERGAMRAVFPDHTYLGEGPWIQFAVELGALRLLALDTVVPGAPHGELDAPRLAWLDQELKRAPDTPTVVCMHHPPFRTGIWRMDTMGLLSGVEEFSAIIGRNPQVERIVCGHLHRPICRRLAHTVVVTAPSVAHQVALSLGEGRALGVVREPPACLLHVFSPELGLVTHTSYIGTYGGPHTVIPAMSSAG